MIHFTEFRYYPFKEFVIKKACLIIILSALLLSFALVLSSCSQAATPGYWFAGDVHLHTTHTDGQHTVDEMAQAAIDAGLDFIIVTDHDTLRPLEDINSANMTYDDFLVMLGVEITQDWGHFVAYNVSYLPYEINEKMRESPWEAQEAIDGLLEHNPDALIFLAHPLFPNFPWDYPDTEGFHGIETWNSYDNRSYDHPDSVSAFAWWDELNNDGRRILSTAVSDAHRRDYIGSTRIHVYAPSLEEDSIIAAIRNGTYYGTNGPELTFSAGNTMMGGSHRVGRGTNSVSLTVGGSYTSNITQANLIVNGDIEHTWFPNEAEFSDTHTIEVSRGDFARLEIFADGNHFAFSNPIWFD